MPMTTLIATANQRVLTFLADHPSRAYFEKEIAQASGVSIVSAHHAVKSLLAEGLLQLEKRGRMCFYTVNVEHPLVRQWKVLATLTRLEPLLAELRGLTQRIVLFGSCATGTNREDSDLDLYVLASDVAAAQGAVAHSPMDGKVQLVAKTLLEDVELQQRNPVFYEQVQRGLVLWEARGELGI